MADLNSPAQMIKTITILNKKKPGWAAAIKRNKLFELLV